MSSRWCVWSSRASEGFTSSMVIDTKQIITLIGLLLYFCGYIFVFFQANPWQSKVLNFQINQHTAFSPNEPFSYGKCSGTGNFSCTSMAFIPLAFWSLVNSKSPSTGSQNSSSFVSTASLFFANTAFNSDSSFVI